MTHLSMWMKNSATGRGNIGPLFSVGVRVFLQQNKKAASVPAAAFNTGREEQLSWSEIRSLSLATVFDRSTAAVGSFITKLIALLPLGGEGGGRNITKGITKQTKLSSFKSKEWKDAQQQLNIVYYFWACFLVQQR